VPIATSTHAEALVGLELGGDKGREEDVRSAVTDSISLYNPEQKNLKKEEHYRKMQLQEYVRNNLFPKWKFFTDRTQVIFNDKEGGIVIKICNDLNVSVKGRSTWWELNKDTIVRTLNKKRGDVTSLLKKKFQGKNKK